MNDFDFGKDVDNLTREERTIEELMELSVYDEQDINNCPDEFFHQEYLFTAGRDKFDFIMMFMKNVVTFLYTSQFTMDMI